MSGRFVDGEAKALYALARAQEKNTCAQERIAAALEKIADRLPPAHTEEKGEGRG